MLPKMNHRTGKSSNIHKPHAREANGLDLSGFIIIVDSIAVKNSPYMQFLPDSQIRGYLNAIQGDASICS